MILDEIAEYTKERVRALKAYKSLYAVRDEAEGRPQGKDFRAAIAAPGLSVIAELKKASPSKGIIAPDFTDIYLRKAAEYEAGGAAAISCEVLSGQRCLPAGGAPKSGAAASAEGFYAG